MSKEISKWVNDLRLKKVSMLITMLGLYLWRFSSVSSKYSLMSYVAIMLLKKRRLCIRIGYDQSLIQLRGFEAFHLFVHSKRRTAMIGLAQSGRDVKCSDIGLSQAVNKAKASRSAVAGVEKRYITNLSGALIQMSELLFALLSDLAFYLLI